MHHVSWTNAKVRKSTEGSPNTSSLICVNLPLCHLGRCCSCLLASLPHTVCLDSVLIYYSIIRVIGCVHGLLPSGRIYKQDRKNPPQLNFCCYHEMCTYCETQSLFQKAFMAYSASQTLIFLLGLPKMYICIFCTKQVRSRRY